MHKDQFTATGPSFTGSGFPRAAFSNNNQSNKAPQDFIYGVNVQGSRCGVFGESVNVSSGRDSTVEGVGVHGFGENFGVFGNGNRGIAGVFGQNNRGRTGVIGAAMRGGTGVLGVSMSGLGNPLSTFEALPDPATGSGVGVYGASGSGVGVFGASSSGPGVKGTSDEGAGGEFSSSTGIGVEGNSFAGPGVHGVSQNDRGGVFQAGTSGRSSRDTQIVAQIRLVPLRQRTFFPQLPRKGKVGDLLLIRYPGRRILRSAPDECSLWLCIPKGPSDDSDQWQEVVLGAVATGTA